jgi:hypothetical protein
MNTIVIINILEMNEKKESYFIHVDAHGSLLALPTKARILLCLNSL